jgi:hypothetical protein
VGPLHNLNYAPVGFIIDSSIANDVPPAEVFPFDTGALDKGLLAEDIHPNLSPFDLALEPALSSAQTLAALFFGDDRSYFNGEPKPDTPRVKRRPTDADIVAYERLVKRGANLSRDERATSIEFHFKKPLQIRGRAIAIILPQEFLDDEGIKTAIMDAKIVPMPYEFLPAYTVKECAGVFYQRAADFYNSEKSNYGWEWS